MDSNRYKGIFTEGNSTNSAGIYIQQGDPTLHAVSTIKEQGVSGYGRRKYGRSFEFQNPKWLLFVFKPVVAIFGYPMTARSSNRSHCSENF